MGWAVGLIAILVAVAVGGQLLCRRIERLEENAVLVERLRTWDEVRGSVNVSPEVRARLREQLGWEPSRTAQPNIERIKQALLAVYGIVGVEIEPVVRRYLRVEVTVVPSDHLVAHTLAVANAWNRILDSEGYFDHDFRLLVEDERQKSVAEADKPDRRGA